MTSLVADQPANHLELESITGSGSRAGNTPLQQTKAKFLFYIIIVRCYNLYISIQQ